MCYTTNKEQMIYIFMAISVFAFPVSKTLQSLLAVLLFPKCT